MSIARRSNVARRRGDRGAAARADPRRQIDDDLAGRGRGRGPNLAARHRAIAPSRPSRRRSARRRCSPCPAASSSPTSGHRRARPRSRRRRCWPPILSSRASVDQGPRPGRRESRARRSSGRRPGRRRARRAGRRARSLAHVGAAVARGLVVFRRSRVVRQSCIATARPVANPDRFQGHTSFSQTGPNFRKCWGIGAGRSGYGRRDLPRIEEAHEQL